MKKLCLGTAGVLAMTLLIASVALLAARVLQKVVELQVKQQMVLKNGTEIFEMWEESPPPVYMQFYFFNLTNPLEVLQGEKPLVLEVGPYTYRETRPRAAVHILDNDTEVSSLNPKTYFLEREMSVGDPEVDLIRTVNVPAVVAMNLATSTPLHLPAEILLLLYEEELFTVHTAHELLWGYTDKLLNALHKFRPTIDADFGFLKSKLSWWTSPVSNMINGTDGSTFHPLIGTDEKIYVFSSDLCRSLYLTFDEYVTVEGIPAYRFVPPVRLFANVSTNPDNAGFCVPAGNCLGAGLLNVSACKQGAPIFLSPPHFYLSDEKYANAIDGMHPNKENHEIFLDINPFSGVLVRAAKRMQVNVHIQKLPDFLQTGNIRTLFFPVLYINESVVLDRESATKLRAVLFESSVVTNIPFIIMVLGVIFGVVFVVLACKPSQAREEGSVDERAPLIRTS